MSIPTGIDSDAPVRASHEIDINAPATALNKGQAGLIAVDATNMADQIAAFLKAQNKYVSK